MPPDTASPRRNRLCFVLVPSLLFVLIPAFVLKENIDDLADFDPKAFFFLALAAVAVSFVLLSVDLLVRRATGSPRFSAVIEYVCFFVVVTGFVLPASKSVEMVDPWLLEVDAVHVGLAALLALAMSWISSTNRRRPLHVAVVAFVSFNAAASVPALYSLRSAPDWDARGISRLSKTRNILVMSFDAVSGSAVREVLEEHPEIEEGFAGFVFYDRVASSSPATSASTAASLYGNRNYKEDYRTSGELWGSAPRRLLTNSLDDNGYEVSTLGIYNTRFAQHGRRHVSLAPRPPASVLTLLNYSLARALTRVAVLRGGPVERLEEWVQEVLTRSDEETRDLMGKISASRSPRWKWELLTPTVLDLREYIRRLEIATPRPVAHFVHFTFTHYPVEFDGDCQFRGHDREWFKSMQNRRGAREEARCILKQAGQFVEALKALGAFDHSLVVLKSDHGRQRKYGEPGSMEAEGIRDHWMLGYGRYRPFLAIKDFGPARGGVRHDTSPVILDDLARTLCRNSGSTSDCTAYPGYDLLGSDDLTGMENAEVTLFVVESPEDDGRYMTHEGITVRRGTDIVASLCATLASEPNAPPVICDES